MTTMYVKKKKRTIGDKGVCPERSFKALHGGFSGWGVIEDTYNDIEAPSTRDIFNGLFLLGCRAMELPRLERWQVELGSSPTHIRIKSMYVEKQRTKEFQFNKDDTPKLDDKGKRVFKLVSTPGYRSFPIRKDNPMANIFIKFIEEGDFYRDTKLFPYTYGQIYYRICTIGMELPPGVPKTQWARHMGPWWPHRIRAERACQIIRDYRWDISRRKKWFGWATSSMAERYGAGLHRWVPETTG